MKSRSQAAARPLPAAPETTAKLRPNPFSQVTVRRENGCPVELRLWSVTKSRGAVTRNYARGGSADFDRIYQAAAASGAQSAKSLSDLVLLAALGLWVPDCDLIDAVHLHAPIRPRPGTRAQPVPFGAFALRGEAWLQGGAEPPAHLAAFPLGCLSADRPILWHRGAPSEPILPWWPTPDCLAAIATLSGPAPRLSRRTLPALLALAEQGIVTRAPIAGPGRGWSEPDQKTCAGSFSRHGYAVVRQLLPPGQIAALRGYWRKLAALDVIPDRGDDGARRGSHGEPSSALLLHLLQPVVERVVGAELKPAYSYAWVYRRGAHMPVHRDRDACRYTASLLVDYAPGSDGLTPWPLGIHPPGGGAPVEIRQSVGDLIVFDGRDLRHFRPPFRAGSRSTSLLLHYVNCDFSGVMF